MPDNAQFCMQCGARFEPAPQAPPPAPPSADAPKRPKWIALGAVLVLVAALGIYLGASGLLKSRAAEPSGRLLQARGAQTTPGLLESQARPDSGLPQSRGPEPRQRVEMPADVRAWLEHLERTEKRRIELTQDQLGGLMVRMVALKMGGAIEVLKGLTSDDPDAPITPPHEDFKAEIAKIRSTWNELNDGFNSVPPPEECVPIQRSYDQALRETGAMMQDVLAIVNDSTDKPDEAVAKLIKMQGGSTSRIDEPARRTDRQVADICDKYETRKWFDITGDVGGGGMLQKLGGL